MLLARINHTKHGVDAILGLDKVLLTHVLEGTLHVAAKVITGPLSLLEAKPQIFTKALWWQPSTH